jgi:hypothetical protein
VIEDLAIHTLVLARCLSGAARQRFTERSDRHGPRDDAGVSTLEIVIIALGLMAVAALLVTAITAAVTRRTNQIK